MLTRSPGLLVTLNGMKPFVGHTCVGPQDVCCETHGYLPLSYLISRASGENELAVGVETETVDLSSVSVHRVAGCGCVVGPSVPSGGE